MRIVISCAGYLFGWGGTQRYSQVVSEELVKNHDVIVYSKKFNKNIADQFKCKVTDIFPNNADLYILDNQDAVKQVKSGKIIFVSHSLTIENCYPPPGVDGYVAISPELRDFNKKRGIDCVVIPNPAPDSWFEVEPTSANNPKILAFTRYGSHLDDLLRLSNIEYDLITEVENNVKDLLLKYDLIICRGRMVIEAMALGRAVISLDRRRDEKYSTGWGYLDPFRAADYFYDNFSGRSKLSTINPDIEIAKYRPTDGMFNQAQARHWLGFMASNVVSKLLTLYGQISK